jgi:hypothetical protein
MGSLRVGYLAEGLRLKRICEHCETYTVARKRELGKASPTVPQSDEK